MKLALFFGVCLAFVSVVESFVEDEFVEDEEENEARHHLRKVSYQPMSQKGQTISRKIVLQENKSVTFKTFFVSN